MAVAFYLNSQSTNENGNAINTTTHVLASCHWGMEAYLVESVITQANYQEFVFPQRE